MRAIILASKAVLAAIVMLGAVNCASAQPERLRAEDRKFAYDAQLPACDSPSVIGRIQSRFDGREAGSWNSALTLTTIDRVKETRFRPNGSDLIPRRYCTARATLSNGRHHALQYNLIEDAGITGWHGSLFLGLVRFPTPASYSLEWCINGLDRSWTYSPDCRMARP
jgi:hypothetical protein